MSIKSIRHLLQTEPNILSTDNINISINGEDNVSYETLTELLVIGDLLNSSVDDLSKFKYEKSYFIHEDAKEIFSCISLIDAEKYIISLQHPEYSEDKVSENLNILSSECIINTFSSYLNGFEVFIYDSIKGKYLILHSNSI